jgi:hypothetical protein
MKRKAWRTYYGYRPATLAEIGRLWPIDIQRQEKDYCTWLARARAWSFEAAEEYARAFATCEILTADEERKSEACKEIRFSARVAVRIVKSWSRSCKLHYAPASGKWSAPGARGYGNSDATWFKSDAPTLYRVIVDGREVDSFLTKGRALAKAEALAAMPRYSPEAMEAWS